MKTTQQLQNLRDALVWWPKVDPASVIPGLSRWKQESPCGTLACFGGHCTTEPSLQAQGIRADVSGAPHIVQSDKSDIYDRHVEDLLFGDHHLFHWRGGHPADKGFEGNSHELVTYRLQHALAQG